MSHVLKLVGCMSGYPTPHDGRYVVEYVPAAMTERGAYYGGTLVTTEKHADARRFADAAEAFRCWQLQNGSRPDGRPNRPLSGWTAEIIDESDLK